MKEYFNPHSIVENPLPIPGDTYHWLHQHFPIFCHDVFVTFQEPKPSILLVRRENVPARGELWPLGGRVIMGKPVLESLAAKVQAEAGLTLMDPTYLGSGRPVFETDPFGHGKGTDTTAVVYAARGGGEVNLDKLHSMPTLVTPAQYRGGLRETLHPYVRDFMDLAIAHLEGRTVIPRAYAEYAEELLSPGERSLVDWNSLLAPSVSRDLVAAIEAARYLPLNRVSLILKSGSGENVFLVENSAHTLSPLSSLLPRGVKMEELIAQTLSGHSLDIVPANYVSSQRVHPSTSGILLSDAVHFVFEIDYDGKIPASFQKIRVQDLESISEIKESDREMVLDSYT